MATYEQDKNNGNWVEVLEVEARKNLNEKQKKYLKLLSDKFDFAKARSNDDKKTAYVPVNEDWFSLVDSQQIYINALDALGISGGGGGI